MVAELLGRAGGLSAAKALDLDRPLPPLARDVVLWSDYGGAKKTDHGLARLAESGALVIAFASAENLSLGSSLRPGCTPDPARYPGRRPASAPLLGPEVAARRPRRLRPANGLSSPS